MPLRHTNLYIRKRLYCSTNSDKEIEDLRLEVEGISKQINELALIPSKCWKQLHTDPSQTHDTLNQQSFEDIFSSKIYDELNLPRPYEFFTRIDLQVTRDRARRDVDRYVTGVYGRNKDSHKCCLTEHPIQPLLPYISFTGSPKAPISVPEEKIPTYKEDLYVHVSWEAHNNKKLKIAPTSALDMNHEMIADNTKLQLVHLLFPWICDKSQYERILQLRKTLGNKAKSGSLLYAFNRLENRPNVKGRRQQVKTLIDDAQKQLTEYHHWKVAKWTSVERNGFPDQPLATSEHHDLFSYECPTPTIFKGQLPYDHYTYFKTDADRLYDNIMKPREIIYYEYEYEFSKEVPTVRQEYDLLARQGEETAKIVEGLLESNFIKMTDERRGKIVGLHTYLSDIITMKVWYTQALHNHFAVKYYNKEWRQLIDDFYNFDDFD